MHYSLTNVYDKVIGFDFCFRKVMHHICRIVASTQVVLCKQINLLLGLIAVYIIYIFCHIDSLLL